ncbi:MAG: Ig-like domain-containing protein [Proteobacteria bacterium]|nr:Ig-like domain-containing protein [Pseudomonadota bacterium]
MNKQAIARLIRGVCSALVALALVACGGGGGTKNTVGITGGTGGTGGTNGTGTTTLAIPVVVQYLASEPAVIYVAGAPGATRSNVSFRLLDALNQAVAGRTVLLQLVDASSGASLQNAAADGGLRLVSDVDGRVTAGVLSGSVPGAVRVRATVVDFPLVAAVSQELTVAVGRPAQRAMSISRTIINIEGDSRDGSETQLTVALADRNGNPVPDGTQVNLVADAGVLIPASCVTTEGSSRCTVTLRSQGTRTASGRVTILAYTPGEEDFTDINGNNRWDAGEAFGDLGQAFRDSNENNTYDVGEFFVPRAGASVCGGGLLGRPNTCDGAWGEADLRTQTVVVFASSFASIGERTGSAAEGFIRFKISDRNGNNMPFGSAISVSVVPPPVGTTACRVESLPTSVPNQVAPTDVLARLFECSAGDLIQVQVRTLNGAETFDSFLLN